jgi:cytochrome c556
MNNCADKAYKLASAFKHWEIVNEIWDTYAKFEFKDQKLLDEMQSRIASARENVKKARVDLEKSFQGW